MSKEQKTIINNTNTINTNNTYINIYKEKIQCQTH